MEELSEVRVCPYLGRIENEDVENDNSITKDWVKIFWLFNETEIDSEDSKALLDPNLCAANLISSVDPYLVILSFGEPSNQTKLSILNAKDFRFLPNLEDEHFSHQILGTTLDPLTFILPGKVYQTSFLHLPTPVLLLVSCMNLRAVVLKSFGGREPTRTPSKVVFTNPRLQGDLKISCDGEWLLTHDAKNSSEDLVLYKVLLVSFEEDLQLQLMFTFKPLTMPFVFHIYKKMVYTMEPSGHIRAYQIKFSSDECAAIENVALFSQSELKKDLRYPNPTTFIRNFVFSSTVISAELLRYWHMDRGRDFWILGDLFEIYKDEISQINDESSNVFTLRLHQAYLGHETEFVVSAIHYQRGILFCGTKQGHIIGYKFARKEIESLKNNFEDPVRPLPLMRILCAAEQPITRLGCLFTPFGIVLAVLDIIGNCSFVSLSPKNLS